MKRRDVLIQGPYFTHAIDPVRWDELVLSFWRGTARRELQRALVLAQRVRGKKGKREAERAAKRADRLRSLVRQMERSR